MLPHAFLSATWEFEGKPVKIVTDENGKQWLCGKDVCEILGYRNFSNVLAKKVKKVYKSPLKYICGTEVDLTYHEGIAAYVSEPR